MLGPELLRSARRRFAVAQRSTPVDVIGIAGASDLDLGDRHTCVVLADATVECWGSNFEGQIGQPSNFPVPVQTAVVGAAVPQIAIPLSPARLLDTRSANSTVDGLFAGGGRRGAGSVLELAVTGRGGVPVGAAAVVVNVTVVDPLAAGFATLFPCGSAVPVASSLNYGPGDVVPNELVAKVGVGGKVCVFTDAATHLLADVVGLLAGGAGVCAVESGAVVGYAVGELDGGWVVRGWWSSWCGFGVGVGGDGSWWCAGGCGCGGGERDGGGSVGGGVRDVVPVWVGGAGGVESELRAG